MGGNVFQGAKPIKKEDIKPTLARFFAELSRVFPKVGVMESSEISLVGSAGKKAESGDIDLCLDQKVLEDLDKWGISPEKVEQLYNKVKSKARTATEEQMRKRAALLAIAERIKMYSSRLKVDTKGTGNGTIFFEFPQFDDKGTFLDKDVQIDLNVGDPELLKFMYYSEAYPKSNLKGLHRTQLLIALFLNKGLTLGHNYGVKDKNTQKIIADSPQKIKELLERLYNVTIKDDKVLYDFNKLYDFLEKNLNQEDFDKVRDIYLGILDHTRVDIPKQLENYWLDNQTRLNLTGKFLPKDSVLYPFRTE